MSREHRHLSDQVIVITGASSGIGLTTAEMAARKGARVVLSARTEEKLRKIVSKLGDEGHEAAYFVGDVGWADDMLRLAEFAIRTFGRIDTWVNNAGISIFGKLEDVELEAAKRMFDTNFWGVVNGCEAALPALRRSGGVIINVGSVVSDTSIPLQGFYAASKHAVKGYTDALRVELEEAGEPIEVCLIKPTSVNTPYVTHAQNLMHTEPDLPAPVYAPEVVARAILECAVHPHRDVYVGGAAAAMGIMGRAESRVGDRYLETAVSQQHGDSTELAPWEGQLFAGEPDEEPQRYGPLDHHMMRWSLYTSARLHPLRTAATAILGIGALVFAGRRAMSH